MACSNVSNGTNKEDAVKEFYGKTLKTSTDLKTSACSSQSHKLPKIVLDALKSVHSEVTSKYYGCGPVFPTALNGTSVLDLGCGSGQDCYVLSKLVGPQGSVVGLDMTDEQLVVANKYVNYHTELFNYNKPNIKFVCGYIEKMEEAGLHPNQFDIIVSNCVINLCRDKKAVFAEAFKVLKEGGELYFSDVYTDSELSPEIRNNDQLWCEGFGGALHWKEMHKLAKEIGFSTPHLVSAGLYGTDHKNFTNILGSARFVSVTYRLFKLPSSASCGPATVAYNGDIEGFEEGFCFDHSVNFKAGEKCQVKDNLASILLNTRYKQYFTICPNEQSGEEKHAVLEKDPFEYCAERGNKKW